LRNLLGDFGLHAKYPDPHCDERVFELPLGFSDRLHARLEAEIRAIAPAPSVSEEKDAMEKKASLKEPDEPSGE
jgi:hypothetical protein